MLMGNKAGVDNVSGVLKPRHGSGRFGEQLSADGLSAGTNKTSPSFMGKGDIVWFCAGNPYLFDIDENRQACAVFPSYAVILYICTSSCTAWRCSAVRPWCPAGDRSDARRKRPSRARKSTHDSECDGSPLERVFRLCLGIRRGEDGESTRGTK